MNFKVSAKRNDKWFNFGRIAENKWGKLQLSFKNTPELKEHINNGGEWLNFSLFEDKPKEEIAPTQVSDLDDEIPF